MWCNNNPNLWSSGISVHGLYWYYADWKNPTLSRRLPAKEYRVGRYASTLQRNKIWYWCNLNLSSWGWVAFHGWHNSQGHALEQIKILGHERNVQYLRSSCKFFCTNLIYMYSMNSLLIKFVSFKNLKSNRVIKETTKKSCKKGDTNTEQMTFWPTKHSS